MCSRRFVAGPCFTAALRTLENELVSWATYFALPFGWPEVQAFRYHDVLSLRSKTAHDQVQSFRFSNSSVLCDSYLTIQVFRKCCITSAYVGGDRSVLQNVALALCCFFFTTVTCHVIVVLEGLQSFGK